MLGATGIAQRTSVPDKTRVLVVLDCSKSMWDKWQSDTKIKVTQRVLLRELESLQGYTGMEVALRLFGSDGQGFYATQLAVPFGKVNFAKLQSKIKALMPLGGASEATKPQTLNDFPAGDDARNILLIISDGIDGREGAICDIAYQEQRNSAIAEIFTVGIGSDRNLKVSPNCGGPFYSSASEESLYEVVHELFQLSDQKARVTLELLDSEGTPYEAEVPIALYDRRTHEMKYATVYHYDPEHGTDTLMVDPLASYDIAFYTKPPILSTGYQFKGGQHNRVTVTAPQGSLRLHYENKRTAFQIASYSMLVRRHGEQEVLAIQPMETPMTYLAGSYDLELLSTPPLKLSNVTVRSGSATDLQIPVPGQLALEKPKVATTGSVFAFSDGGMKWVCDLGSSFSERIVLMPGEYQVILKPQEAMDYSSARTARFTITSAQQTSVNLEKQGH